MVSVEAIAEGLSDRLRLLVGKVRYLSAVITLYADRATIRQLPWSSFLLVLERRVSRW
jgi:hypothetical protein